MASRRTISRLPGAMGRLAGSMFMLIGIVCAAAPDVSAGVISVGHDINTLGTTVDFTVTGALASPSEGVNPQRDPEAEPGVESTRASERQPVERIASPGPAVGGAQYPATGFSLCSARLLGGEGSVSGDSEASGSTMTGVGLGSAAAPGYAGKAVQSAIKPKAAAAAGRRYSFYSPAMNLLAETEIKTDTAKPAPLYEYVWFNGHPVAQIDAPSSTHWTFTDHLGTPLIQTDNSGTVYWRAEYEPYGKVFAYNPSTLADQHQPLRLPGQEAEQLNLGPNGLTERSYNIFRWYRAAWGRYTQSDPIDLLQEGSDGWPGMAQASPRSKPPTGASQAYAYVFSSPIRYKDPLGLRKCESGKCPDCPSGIWISASASGSAFWFGGRNYSVVTYYCVGTGVACTFATSCWGVGIGYDLGATFSVGVAAGCKCAEDLGGGGAGFEAGGGAGLVGKGGGFAVSTGATCGGIYGAVGFGVSLYERANINCNARKLNCYSF